MRASVIWDQGMRFNGVPGSGHRVVMDLPLAAGGEDAGPRPTEMVLLGLGGCSGVDVVAILRKMRVSFDRFSVEIEAERTGKDPKVFTSIHMTYRIWGEDLPPQKFLRAVSLSQEKYCSVAHMLNRTADITFACEINGQPLHGVGHHLGGGKPHV